MAELVSKARAKMTRNREKLAGKPTTAPTRWADRGMVRLAIGLVLWATAVMVVHVDVFAARSADATLAIIADAALLLAGLFASALALHNVKPGLLPKTSTVLLLALVSLASLGAGRLVLMLTAGSPWISGEVAMFLLPLAMAPILTTILLDGAAGIAVGVWTSLGLALSAEAEAGLLLFIAGLVSSAVASSLAHRVRTRAKIIHTGLVAGLSEIICLVSLCAVKAAHIGMVDVLSLAGVCVVSGFLSAVLALLILPLFETLFHITTDITLLELTDLGHPLLQRLAIEAPGTYHHSLVVANLAQAAADEIGANSLQARVCAYFHDIGKLCKPGFFAENIRVQNPHDKLPPSMSKLVITSHVKEGVSLAMLHKLPRPVIDVILEHHGNSVLAYFHDKARNQVEFKNGQADRANADEWNFRYTGPRPSTPESAIISLADPIEAASRSVEKVTPAHLEELVDAIVKARIDDGQLDDSNLTLNQLARVKKSFVFSLTNMLHARTPYPKDEDRDKQPPKPAPGGSSPVGAPDLPVHG